MRPHGDPFTEGDVIVVYVIVQVEYRASSSTTRAYMHEVGVVILIPEIADLTWCLSISKSWSVG